MSQTIEKGITIAFRGDTADFDEAVKSVNGELINCKKELSLLNRELKLDPTNVDKLNQKLDTLKEKEKLINEEINAYQEAMKQLDPASVAFKQNEARCRELSIQLEYTKKDIQNLSDEINNFAKKQQLEKIGEVGKKFESIGDKTTEIGKKLSTLSVVATGVLGKLVKDASDFESSMSQVNATMGITSDSTTTLNGKLVNTSEALSDLAREMGAKTAFSANEASQALNYLALAGYDVQQMADTLPIVLNLASAGGIQLAQASDMVTDAMSALGLATSDASVLVDQMAKASSSSNTSVAQLGEAILSIGATAKNLKGGTTELNTALGLLANNGIKGAEAGTKLRNIILSLQNPTDKAQKQFNKLGIAIYDNEGNMRGLDDILGDLNNSMSDLTEADKATIISDIFNKADLASAQALLANVGDEWGNLSQAIINSGGSAQQMADTQLDNLNGQMTILQSGLSELSISLGQTLLPIIKNIISFVQKITDKLNSLSTEQKEKLVLLLEIVAGIAPMLLILGTTLTFVGNVLTAVSAGASVFNAILSANPIGIVIIAIGALIAIIATLIIYWEDIKTAVKNTWEQFKQTEWVQNLITWFDSLIEKVKSVIDWFKSLFQWISDTIGKVKDFFSSGFEKIGSWVGGLFDSGGFGNLAYASGGYGTLELNTTINVNNNGQNLSKYQAQQFGREIVEYVNDKLGRRI